jgi:hypothetical protein
VIETQVHRSFARNAKLAFYLTALVVALPLMTVLADRMHPIIAAIVAVVVGTLLGALAWALVRMWPILRLLWWWSPEITLALVAVYGWTALARNTTLPLRLAFVVGVVGVPAAIPAIRRRIEALAWCVIVRHRLRVCFAQFIIRNRAGTLPLILWSRPTPVGERVWIYLRPGLSEADLQSDLDKIAVACHAAAVLVERASDRNAAYLRIDIKRREVLNAKVHSPLPGLVDPDTPAVQRDTATVPTALDLPDVAEPATTNGRRPATTTAAKPAPTPTTGSADDDDVSQWI